MNAESNSKMSTEMNNEIQINIPLAEAVEKKKVIVRKKKVNPDLVVVENKKLIVEEDAGETETEGKKLLTTNPVIVEDLFAVAQKEYEENIQQEDALAEMLTEKMDEDLANAEEDELAAMLREKAELDLKIKNYEASKALRKNVEGCRTLLLRNRQDKMDILSEKVKALQDEWEDLEKESDAIKDLDDDELTSTIMGDEKLKKECGILYVPKETEPYVPVFERPATKKVKKTAVADGEKKAKRKIDRKLSWSLVPTNAILKATYDGGKYNLFVRKNSKGGLTEVKNIEDPKKRTKDDKEFPDITNANKYFCEDMTQQVRSGNAWALFKAYNKQTKKCESLEEINDNNIYDCVDVEKYLW